MITRSVVQIYGCSPHNFNILISQMDDYELYHCEMPYDEAKYSASLYDLPQDTDVNMKENTPIPFCHIVDDMLMSSNTSEHESIECEKKASSDANKKTCASLNKISLHKLGPNDEFETFSYSNQDIISAPALISEKFSSPLGHSDRCQSYSPYDESKSDSEMNEVKPTCLEQRNYDTSSLMYDNDDLTTFSGLVNCDEVLKNHKPKETSNDQNGTIVCCYRSGSSSSASDEGSGKHNEQMDKKCVKKSENYFSVQEASIEDTDNRKGKISGLQRKALDSIFSVIDRPSRGLVLHIAGELCLHHITVKNFFSNGRRRLRRAAARLNDPERTRRENQKRKEKRRLAALAASASAANGDKGGGPSSKGSHEGGGGDAHSSREPPVLSPERRALMEKLAVKVQRSVAQKGLASGIGESACLPATLASSTLHNSINISTKNLENNISPHLHSNSVNLNEPRKLFPLQQVEDSFLTQNGEEFTAMFSYSESKPTASYDSSPDQNSVSNYSSEQENTNSYAFVGQEGPYSPTSWQTLLHT